MHIRQSLYRKTAGGAVALLALMLGFAASNPYSDIPALVRVAEYILLVVLLVGILPGSYIARWISSSSQIEAVRRSRLLQILALLAPLLLLMTSTVAVLDNLSTLNLIDTTSFDAVNRGWVQYNIARYLVIGCASLAWLALSGVTLLASRIRGHQPTG